MIVLAALILAASGPGASAAPATALAGDPDQMICRQRPVTGTRLRFTRTCMTRREWATHREEATRGMRNFITREMTSQPAPSITPGSE
jgi:hypothetical protein